MATTRANSPATRALGAELRSARNQTGLTVRALADKLAMPKTRISRWETGSGVPQPEQVASYLTALGVTGDEYERILEQARTTESPSWVTSGIPGVQKELASLVQFENTATEIIDVAPMLIPGLLQTADYMRAVMNGMDDKQIGPRILTRMERRTTLTKPDAPAFTALIGENALREPFGGRAAMAEQLAHLVRTANDVPNVTVRIIRSGAETFHPAHAGHFVLMRFPNADPIIEVEHFSSLVFLKSPRDIAAHAKAVETLSNRALSPAESIDLITEIRTTMEG